jgi:hypothetical protein
VARREWNPDFEKCIEILKTLLRYKNHQLQHNDLQEALKLKKTNTSHFFTPDFKNFPT